MADQVQELLDVPREFLRDGLQFINRSQKRESPLGIHVLRGYSTNIDLPTADRKEFTKICQAVGVGFLIMGAVGYVVKLSRTFPPPPKSALADYVVVHIPLNNVLVGAA